MCCTRCCAGFQSPTYFPCRARRARTRRSATTLCLSVPLCLRAVRLVLIGIHSALCHSRMQWDKVSNCTIVHTYTYARTPKASYTDDVRAHNHSPSKSRARSTKRKYCLHKSRLDWSLILGVFYRHEANNKRLCFARLPMPRCHCTTIGIWPYSPYIETDIDRPESIWFSHYSDFRMSVCVCVCVWVLGGWAGRYPCASHISHSLVC